MWYEQFYSGIITITFTGIAIYASGVTNYLDNGRIFRRDLSGIQRPELLKRDHRLTGNYYKLSGLDSIKD